MTQVKTICNKQDYVAISKILKSIFAWHFTIIDLHIPAGYSEPAHLS